MERRRFLVGACSLLVGTSGFGRAVVAKPCPPDLTGSGSSTLCGATGLSLAEAAQALTHGQSTHFTKNNLQRENDIQWQVQTVWFDPSRHEIQYMGKPASSQSRDYSHYIYDETSDRWSTSGMNLFPGTGHIWNVTFDPTNGDYWFRRYDDNALRWFDRSDGTNGRWKQTAEQTSPALNSGNTNFAAMGWHPNLFGPGKPGIFIWAVFRFFAYNLATQEFSVLNPNNFSSSSPFWNRSTGQALFLPGTDQLICFAQNEGNGHPAILVDAGAGNSSDIITDGFVTTTSAPPIQVYGGGGDSNHGHVVNHPNNANRLLLLEEHGTSRVWESADYGATWNLQAYRHPFQAMNNWSAGEFTVGTISQYGIVVGIASNSEGGENVIWKPGA
ncbi:MAG: hypothetical protein WD795_05630 [Woeseia sp.]